MSTVPVLGLGIRVTEEGTASTSIIFLLCTCTVTLMRFISLKNCPSSSTIYDTVRYVLYCAQALCAAACVGHQHHQPAVVPRLSCRHFTFYPGFTHFTPISFYLVSISIQPPLYGIYQLRPSQRRSSSRAHSTIGLTALSVQHYCAVLYSTAHSGFGFKLFRPHMRRSIIFRVGGPEITGRKRDRSPGPSRKVPRAVLSTKIENRSRTSARTRRGVASANEKKKGERKVWVWAFAWGSPFDPDFRLQYQITVQCCTRGLAVLPEFCPAL
jgi:hypothetical protein